VTGAGGFIGSQVLAALADSDWEVYGLRLPGSMEGSTASGVHWQEADLLAREAADELLSTLRPTHLLHLAWPVNYQAVDSLENSRWVHAGERLLRAFAETGGRRVVFAGTCAEYDWSAAGPEGVFSETMPLEGDSPYAAAKVELFRFFEKYSRQARVGSGQRSS